MNQQPINLARLSDREVLDLHGRGYRLPAALHSRVNDLLSRLRVLTSERQDEMQAADALGWAGIRQTHERRTRS